MKTNLIGLLAAVSLFLSGTALAQEHTTQGPVWTLASYQFEEGQFDNYMNWLRRNYLPIVQAQKKAGLIMDYKIFMSERSNPNDGDITFAVLHSSAAKAFDYNAADDDASNAIGRAHWASLPEATREAERDSRYKMRRFISNGWVREITLKPAK